MRGNLHDGNNCSTEWPGDPDADTTYLNQPLLKAISPNITDVVIIAVSAPASVVQGATENVTVTVQNVGNQDVTVSLDVTLTDETDALLMGPQTVASLAAGASLDLNCFWDTSGASLGAHTLTASHNFTDDNSANNAADTTVSVPKIPGRYTAGSVPRIKAIPSKFRPIR